MNQLKFDRLFCFVVALIAVGCQGVVEEGKVWGYTRAEWHLAAEKRCNARIMNFLGAVNGVMRKDNLILIRKHPDFNDDQIYFYGKQLTLEEKKLFRQTSARSAKQLKDIGHPFWDEIEKVLDKALGKESRDFNPQTTP
ncbi:MAG: hypothetical protein H8E27_03980 [Verrucomicrobia subdivision 3 bacterium]|nr:hypothetical protein [Limisphaerales bacterium]